MNAISIGSRRFQALAGLAVLGLVAAAVGWPGVPGRADSADKSATAASAGQLSSFLDLPGVPGDVSLTEYADQIEASALSWGARRPGDGPTSFSVLSLRKGLDRATPRLFSVAARGTTFAAAWVHLVIPDVEGGVRPLMTYRLLNVKVTSVAHDSGSDFDEVVTLRFPRARLSYRTYTATGEPGPLIVCAYNTVAQDGDPC